jgi:hypothetical protein
MTKSSSKKEKAKEPEKPAPKGKPSFGLIALILILGGIAVFALTRNKGYEPPAEPQPAPPVQAQEAPPPPPQPEQPAPPETPQQAPEQSAADHTHGEFKVPAYFENPDLAEPLQPILPTESVPYFAQAGYEIARRKPKLMTQLPCFCYCEKFGHTSLHTCFETTHAVSCDICLKEAIDADRLDSQGMSPQEIREVIIQEYRTRGHNHS